MPRALINGINTYYEVHGSGPPLILLQGLAGEHRAWVFQIPCFKRHFQVFVIDSRGIGGTERSREPFTVQHLASDVICFMDSMAIRNAHILGLSMGGLIAQELALSYPGRVNKLILGSTFTSADSLKEGHRSTGDLSMEPSDYTGLGRQQLIGLLISKAFNRPLYREPIRLLSRVPRRLDSSSYFDQIYAAAGYDSALRLHLIKSPTLVITGAADRIVPPENSDFIAKRIPGAKLVKIKDGSHALFMEKRKAFNDEVLDFLLSV